MATVQGKAASVCSIQSQAMQILQNVDSSSQPLVQQTIGNIERTIRKTILDTMQTSVDQSSIQAFKYMNPGAYNQILYMFGFIDSGAGIQIDPNAAPITDFCQLQNQLLGMLQSYPPEQQALVVNIIRQLNKALKPQVPGLITQVLLENRTNLQTIFQANPLVANQLEGLINEYASSGLLSAFGK